MARALLIVCVLLAAVFAAPAQSSGPRVQLSLIVTNNDNQPLSTIRKEDVHVFENKVEQTILSVEPDTRPIDLVLAIDASGSFKKWLGSALKAAGLIVRSARPEDEVMVERFISSDKISTAQDFTRDTPALLKAVDSFYLEEGQSAVIDALYLAADAVHKRNQRRPYRRQVVVVITDGDERNSYYKAETLINFQRARDVQVFALGLTSDLKSSADAKKPGPRERAEKLLKAVADESGGRVFLAASENDLLSNATQLVAQIRQQFVITYQSSDATGKKGFRLIDVKLDAPNEQITIIAPRAYYFPSVDATPEKKEKKSP
jgi:Ca-activated chloride channel family protein